jgi:DeoR/GlpR family transcriptional regulator of sugar metabolism
VAVGGIVRPGYYTVGGIRALENLESFSASKVFMSVDAIDIEHGITNASEFEVGVKQKLIQMAKHVYLLTDYTKIDTHNLYRVAPITSVQTSSGSDDH